MNATAPPIFHGSPTGSSPTGAATDGNMLDGGNGSYKRTVDVAAENTKPNGIDAAQTKPKCIEQYVMKVKEKKMDEETTARAVRSELKSTSTYKTNCNGDTHKHINSMPEHVDSQSEECKKQSGSGKDKLNSEHIVDGKSNGHIHEGKHTQHDEPSEAMASKTNTAGAQHPPPPIALITATSITIPPSAPPPPPPCTLNESTSTHSPPPPAHASNIKHAAFNTPVSNACGTESTPPPPPPPPPPGQATETPDQPHTSASTNTTTSIIPPAPPITQRDDIIMSEIAVPSTETALIPPPPRAPGIIDKPDIISMSVVPENTEAASMPPPPPPPIDHNDVGMSVLDSTSTRAVHEADSTINQHFIDRTSVKESTAEGMETSAETSNNFRPRANWSTPVKPWPRLPPKVSSFKSYTGEELTNETMEELLHLTKHNMRELYAESSWGWSDVEKRRELCNDNMQFFLVRSLSIKGIETPLACHECNPNLNLEGAFDDASAEDDDDGDDDGGDVRANKKRKKEKRIKQEKLLKQEEKTKKKEEKERKKKKKEDKKIRKKKLKAEKADVTNGLSVTKENAKTCDITSKAEAHITDSTAATIITASDRMASDESKQPLENENEKPNQHEEGEEEGQIIGFAAFVLTVDEGIPLVYLRELQLVSGARGNGIGSFLMGHLEQLGVRSEKNMVMLTVFTNNQPAMGFYRQLGYIIDEASPGLCYNISDSKYEIMSKLLNSTPERFRCPDDSTCTRIFRNPDSLEQHQSSMHARPWPFKCTHDGCDKGVVLKSQLKHHMRSHGVEVEDDDDDEDSCVPMVARRMRTRGYSGHSSDDEEKEGNSDTNKKKQKNDVNSNDNSSNNRKANNDNKMKNNNGSSESNNSSSSSSSEVDGQDSRANKRSRCDTAGNFTTCDSGCNGESETNSTLAHPPPTLQQPDSIKSGSGSAETMLIDSPSESDSTGQGVRAKDSVKTIVTPAPAKRGRPKKKRFGGKSKANTTSKATPGTATQSIGSSSVKSNNKQMVGAAQMSYERVIVKETGQRATITKVGKSGFYNVRLDGLAKEKVRLRRGEFRMAPGSNIKPYVPVKKKEIHPDYAFALQLQRQESRRSGRSARK